MNPTLAKSMDLWSNKGSIVDISPSVKEINFLSFQHIGTAEITKQLKKMNIKTVIYSDLRVLLTWLVIFKFVSTRSHQLGSGLRKVQSLSKTRKSANSLLEDTFICLAELVKPVKLGSLKQLSFYSTAVKFM